MKAKNISTDLIRLSLYLVDFLCLNVSYLITFAIFFSSSSIKQYEITNLIYSNILWIILARIYKPYNLKRFQTSEKMLSKSFKLLFNGTYTNPVRKQGASSGIQSQITTPSNARANPMQGEGTYDIHQAARPIRIHIIFFSQPKYIRSLVYNTQREQWHGLD